MRFSSYVKPSSVEEAYELNQKRSNRVIAGNMWLRLQNISVGTAIDISGLGLDAIERVEISGEDTTVKKSEIRIGAMVSLREFETNEYINACAGNGVRDAFTSIVGVQFRNAATIGGSVVQKAGFSDVVNILAALRADVELYKAGRMPIMEYVGRKRDRDILMYVYIPDCPIALTYFSKRNTKKSLPISAVSIAKDEFGERVCISARPAGTVCYTRNKDEDKAAFKERIMEQTSFGSNIFASAKYRRHLAKVFLERGIMA